jgi:hypothetical protein
MTSEFAQRVADIALAEWTKFQERDDKTQPLKGRVEQYFWEALKHHNSGLEPWGAPFVSWCVKSAGATSQEFRVAAVGSDLAHHAINNPGAYIGHRFDAAAPEPGDIIQYQGGGPKHDFEHAKKNRIYPSHVMIVVEVSKDGKGLFATAIKGNDNHRVGKKRVALTKDGLIEQGVGRHYISLLKCAK